MSWPMKQLTEMFARTADGVLVLDQDQKVVFWNRAAERLLGFLADEVLGRPCHEVMCGETLGGQPLCTAACSIAGRITRGGAVRNFDLQTHTKGGHLLWVNVSSLPIPSRNRSQFLAVHLFRDITKQVKVHRLVDKLHSTLSCGEYQGSEHQADSPPEIPVSLPLSEREREVLRLLALGRTTRNIADSLHVSHPTVRNHIQNILKKLGAHSRLEALAIAFPPGRKSI